MALAVETWMVTKAKAYADLLTAFGSKDKIFNVFMPNTFGSAQLPKCTYELVDQFDEADEDDTVKIERWIFSIDVWTGTDNRTTLANAVDVFMRSIGFRKVSSTDLEESGPTIFRRSLRYANSLTSDDLV